MAIASVDEVMLREPRLLVPGMQPLGPVVVDSSLARWFVIGGKDAVNGPLGSGTSTQQVKDNRIGQYFNGASYRYIAGQDPSANGTYLFEFNTTSLADHNTILCYEDVIGNTGPQIRINTSGTIGFLLTATALLFSGTKTVAVNTINRIAVTVSELSRGTLVVNGEVDVADQSFAASPNSYSPCLGRAVSSYIPSGYEYFNGHIYLAAKFARVFSLAELVSATRDPYQFLTVA